MILRLSGKMAKKIGILPTESLPPAANPLLDWSTHLFTARRIQYILLTNTPSLYSIVLFGRGSKSGSSFQRIVTREMWEYMRLDEHEFTFKQFIEPEMSEVSWSKALNRSVTGSVNDFVQIARYLLDERRLPLYEISDFLNETPMKYLGYDHPADVLRNLRGVEQS